MDDLSGSVNEVLGAESADQVLLFTGSFER